MEIVISCIPEELFDKFVLEIVRLLRDESMDAAIRFLCSYRLSEQLINYFINLAYRVIRMTHLTKEDKDAIGAEYIQAYIKNHTFID